MRWLTRSQSDANGGTLDSNVLGFPRVVSVMTFTLP